LPLKERGIKTDPPSLDRFTRETTQWEIFDSYMNQYEANLKVEWEE